MMGVAGQFRARGDIDRDRPNTLQRSWTYRVLAVFDESRYLDQLGDTVDGWLRPLLTHPRAPRYLDFLHGRWLGHALHPVLTDITIGFWSASLFLETLRARKSAAILNLAGSASAVATAAAGVADWTGTYGRGRRLAFGHGALNVVGLLLQLASASARLRRRHARAYTLSLAGLGVSMASAHLGGELVFSRGVMVDHDAWLSGPGQWTAVVPESELKEGTPRRVEVAGRGILLYRRGRTLTAMEDTCAHAGCSLADGEFDADVVTCGCHGSRYSLLDGSVLQGPSTFPQLLLESRIRSGQVEVRGRTEY